MNTLRLRRWKCSRYIAICNALIEMMEQNNVANVTHFFTYHMLSFPKYRLSFHYFALKPAHFRRWKEHFFPHKYGFGFDIHLSGNDNHGIKKLHVFLVYTSLGKYKCQQFQITNSEWSEGKQRPEIVSLYLPPLNNKIIIIIIITIWEDRRLNDNQSQSPEIFSILHTALDANVCNLLLVRCAHSVSCSV